MIDFPVLSNDPGITPYGGPDQCDYCHQNIGQPHSMGCVIIVRDVIYDVILNDKVLFQWTSADSRGWTRENCEFHKNESSWCPANILANLDADKLEILLENQLISRERCDTLKQARITDDYTVYNEFHYKSEYYACDGLSFRVVSLSENYRYRDE